MPYKVHFHKFEATGLQEIFGAMDLIEKQTCVRFLPKVTTTDLADSVKKVTKVAKVKRDPFVLFTVGKSCSSPIGCRRNETSHEVTLPGFCRSLTTVLHELMHVLGFRHEQCR